MYAVKNINVQYFILQCFLRRVLPLNLSLGLWPSPQSMPLLHKVFCVCPIAILHGLPVLKFKKKNQKECDHFRLSELKIGDSGKPMNWVPWVKYTSLVQSTIARGRACGWQNPSRWEVGWLVHEKLGRVLYVMKRFFLLIFWWKWDTEPFIMSVYHNYILGIVTIVPVLALSAHGVSYFCWVIISSRQNKPLWEIEMWNR